MREIPLTQGKVALVDDEDYERLTRHKWYAVRAPHTFYACRNLPSPQKGPVGMHRAVLGLPPRVGPDGILADHWDGDGLNNQRSNLRQATTNPRHAKCAGHPSHERDALIDPRDLETSIKSVKKG